jgi:hypothetical protein
MPQYVTKMTKDEMEAESKKATLEGMKNLINRFNDLEEPTSDSDSESRLESRIHYMKLDIGNLTLDLSDCKEKLETSNQRLEVFKKIDHELALLGNLEFYLNSLDIMTLEQVKRKLVLFKEEQNEHVQICLKHISQLEFPAIKDSIRLSLVHKKKNNRKIEHALVYYINKKWLIHQLNILVAFICAFFITTFILKKLIKSA